MLNSVRENCYLCLTKWNTNSVLSEWNQPLREWTRSNRKTTDEAEFTPPPSYKQLYSHYSKYLETKFSTSEEAIVLHKMRTILAFFKDRVIFMYNLDGIEWEDKQDNDLDLHTSYLYNFYR